MGFINVRELNVTRRAEITAGGMFGEEVTVNYFNIEHQKRVTVTAQVSVKGGPVRCKETGAAIRDGFNAFAEQLYYRDEMIDFKDFIKKHYVKHMRKQKKLS